MRAPRLLVPLCIAIALLVPASGLAVTVPPLPNCDSSNPNYNPTQATHVFVLAGAFGATLEGQFHGAQDASVFDTSGCAAGDGDNETGQGGAQFPETSQGACDPAAPWSGHHNGGVGATVTVQSNTANLPMDYVAGTDGQAAGVDVAVSPCTGNGVISDSYDTDPFDCGQGVTGHFPGPSADVQPNPNPHAGSTTDPDPWSATYGSVAQDGVRSDPNGAACFGVDDGSLWSFLIFGPSVSDLFAPTGSRAVEPITDISGCPDPVGNGSSVGGGVAGTGWFTGPFEGDHKCGVGSLPGSIPRAGLSTPILGTITAP